MNQENTEKKQAFWQKTGIFFAWSGGFAGAGILATTLLLLIVSLFNLSNFDNFFYHLSNWCFWMSALLLFGGLIAPAEDTQEDDEDDGRRRPSTDKASSINSKDDKSPALDKFEARRRKMMDRRIARVYNPWRWRLWMSALIAFAITTAFGLLAKPNPPL
ncbi:MAG: hypothetical protein JW934_16720 [Anaerolineae bacterium]|nr:hypothetical protein [Anaerolineae bacterium]